MPLLMCPNDSASMQTVQRNGVEFDMCPTCRGVWLDRGELEKLIDGARAAFTADAPAASPWQGQQRNHPPQDRGYDARGEYGERGESGERGEHGYDDRQRVDERGRRRRGGFDLFDMFD